MAAYADALAQHKTGLDVCNRLVVAARDLPACQQVTRLAPRFGPGWATLAYRRAELMMHCPYDRRANQRREIALDIGLDRAGR